MTRLGIDRAKYSIRLALIHHSQQFMVQFFPRNGHGSAGFQIFHAAGDFFAPRFLHRIIGLVICLIICLI